MYYYTYYYLNNEKLIMLLYYVKLDQVLARVLSMIDTFVINLRGENGKYEVRLEKKHCTLHTIWKFMVR